MDIRKTRIEEDFEQQAERDKKFEAILDGVYAFFTGAAILQIEPKPTAFHVMFVKKP